MLNLRITEKEREILASALYAEECSTMPGTEDNYAVAELINKLWDADNEHDEYECMHYDTGCRCTCSECQRGAGPVVDVIWY